MKQIYFNLLLIMAGFTFILIFGIAQINGATLLTSIWRGLGSAGTIFTLCLILVIILHKEMLKSKINQATSGKQEQEDLEQAQEFKAGIEPIINPQATAQIEQDVANLLLSDPERATELLRKMKAE